MLIRYGTQAALQCGIDKVLRVELGLGVRIHILTHSIEKEQRMRVWGWGTLLSIKQTASFTKAFAGEKKRPLYFEV